MTRLSGAGAPLALASVLAWAGLSGCALVLGFDDLSSNTRPGQRAETTAAPSFSLAEGSYGPCERVTLASETPGAVIYFTVDGSEPSLGSPVFTAPLPLQATTTVKAIAVAEGLASSPVVSSTFVITVPGPPAPPRFEPGPGTFGNDVNLDLRTDVPDATLCVTTDGSIPVCGDARCGPGRGCGGTSSAYRAGTPLRVTTSPSTIRAVTCAQDGSPASSIAVGLYELQVVAPTLDPPSGTSVGMDGIEVTMTSTTVGAEIRYTFDGALPTCASGNTYSGPPLFAAAVTVKAVACKAGYAASPVVTAIYKQ